MSNTQLNVIENRTVGMAEIKLSEQEINAALEVLKSGALRQGKHCDSFEQEFAEYCGAKYGVTCSNGSATLHLIYTAILSQGDEVLVPSFTFIATASMVSAAGGKPIFCDIDPESWNIDLEDAASKITEKTKAISPVHLFGNSCDVDAIVEFAEKHNLEIIWDNAHAHGTEYKGTNVGKFGDYSSYSFYPSKNMFVGEGGIILTNNEEHYTKLKFMRSHGQTGKYLHTLDGFNYRMTDVEAAIGREQLKRFDDMQKIRLRNYDFYEKEFANIDGVNTQKRIEDSVHGVHQYCITIDSEKLGLCRDGIQNKLKEKGVFTGVHYPRGLHQQPIFIEKYGFKSLAVTEKVANTIMAIPVHHGVTEEDAQYVVDCFKEVISNK